MTSSCHSRLSTLLPIPKTVQRLEGTLHMTRECPLSVFSDDPRVERAARRWQGGCPLGSTAAASSTYVVIAVDRLRVEHRDGYRLTINAGGVELLGESPAACFNITGWSGTARLSSSFVG